MGGNQTFPDPRKSTTSNAPLGLLSDLDSAVTRHCANHRLGKLTDQTVHRGLTVWGFCPRLSQCLNPKTFLMCAAKSAYHDLTGAAHM
jgi:hypothetical protein